MIALQKKYSPQYDNCKEYFYQNITANNIFPIHDQTPINFEVTFKKTLLYVSIMHIF